MKLENYIRGERHGREAHEVELDGMRDPLLGEAIDGFDAVPGDHAPVIDRLAERIESSARSGRAASLARAQHGHEKRVRVWSVAAAAVLVIGMVGGGVTLLMNGIPGSGTGGDITHEAGINEYISNEVVEILPPVTAIEDDAPTEEIAPTGDIAAFRAAELSDIETGRMKISSARDTTVTDTFRHYLGEALVSDEALASTVRAASNAGDRDWATVSFEVDGNGRPSGIEIVGSSSPEVGVAVQKLLEQGPDWPVEAPLKQITVRLGTDDRNTDDRNQE